MTINNESNRLSEPVVIIPYQEIWKDLFEIERLLLTELLCSHLISIYHYGSTSVPGMPAKPIIDILIEIPSFVSSLDFVKKILVGVGYEYEWRRSWGRPDIGFHAFFIKRNLKGERTHHIHVVETGSPYLRRARITDFLMQYPWLAQLYAELKLCLVERYGVDRIKYTQVKSIFLEEAFAWLDRPDIDEASARYAMESMYKKCLEL